MTNGISMGNNWLSQLSQSSNANQAGGINNGAGVTGADCDGDGGGVSKAGGKLFQAISAALSQIGAGSNPASSDTVGSSSSSSTQDPAKALASFMQELMAALQSQHKVQGGGTQGSGDSDGDNDGSGGVRAGGHRHNIQADLQSLLQQLSASTSASSATGISATDPNSINGSLTGLQQSFQNLVSSFGGSGATAGSLGDFLQAFANNMQGESAVGNVVKTQA